MAQYRGTLKGTRGEASRLGTKKTGLDAHIGSWQGAVEVDMWYDTETDTDMVRVTLCQHEGAGQYPPRVLYNGPVSGVGCQAASGWNVLVIGRETSSDICLDCSASRAEHGPVSGKAA